MALTRRQFMRNSAVVGAASAVVGPYSLIGAALPKNVALTSPSSVITDTQKKEAARELGRDMFGREVTANLNLNDLKAAIDSIDSAMDTIIANIPLTWQTKTIKQALIDNLPEPFQSNSTPQQKAMALTIWANIEAR